MAAPAKNPNHSAEVEGFLETLFLPTQEGFVYCPTKNPSTGHWQTYFFLWPRQKMDIITHIMDASRTKEAYLSPSLFNKPDPKRENWKGSNYVWVDFDGAVPETTLKGVPDPTVRVQSSEKGHEHWYWRLNAFETNMEIVETLSKRLAYTLNADKSGWDSNQVLRPPGTLHHDSKRRVRLLTAHSGTVSLTDFTGLVETPPEVVVNTRITNLPDIQQVIAAYKFGTKAYDLFHKSSQPVGKRSSAMMRMAFDCVEMGMTNEETYVILLNCDDRWGKYKRRTPESRAKVLTGMIAHARNSKAVQAELRLSEYEPMYNIDELFALDFSKVEWIYNEIIADNSVAILASDPGVGKTAFSFQMGLHVAMNLPFVGWTSKMETGQNVGFFQYEMDVRQSRLFLENMVSRVSDENRRKIVDRFKISSLGYAISLEHKEEQQKILDYVDRYDLKFLMFDSIKAVTGLREDAIDRFFYFINKDLRADRNCTVWLIHHNRKAGADGRTEKEQTLEDLYGDVFITSHASTVIGLRGRPGNPIEVASLKSRLAPPFDKFTISREPKLYFQRVNKAPKEKKSDGIGFDAASNI